MTIIIALKGRRKSGKTPTLKLLEQKIRRKYNGNIKTIHEERDIGGSKDIFVILKMSNSVIVGIYSLGDYANEIEKNLQIAISKKCDIIFCACRTRGATIKSVKYLESKIVKVIFKKRCYETDESKQVLINQDQVNDLMSLVQL